MTTKAADKQKAPPAASAALTDPAAQDQGTDQDQAQTEQTQLAQAAPAPPAPPVQAAAQPQKSWQQARQAAAQPDVVRPGAHEGDVELAPVGFRYDMPDGLKARPGGDTLMDACETYGINPDQGILPIELAAWKYYPEDLQTGAPGYIQLVTGGGVKIRHYDDPDYPMDRDTEEKLRVLFGAFTIDPATKLPVATALPSELTLPAEAVDGIPRKQDHKYRKGYLREGGAAEAKRRQARKSRPKRG